MSEFLHMGGYAFFVWTSFCVVAVTLLANIVLATRGHRQIRSQLEAEWMRDAGDNREIGNDTDSTS